MQPFSRPTVHQSTAEADNKRRPGVLRRNSSRYQSPSPEPLDPNSGVCVYAQCSLCTYCCVEIVALAHSQSSHFNNACLLLHVMSEAKSQTIRRMQSSLEDWDKQLEEIVQKKSQYGQYNYYYSQASERHQYFAQKWYSTI